MVSGDWFLTKFCEGFFQDYKYFLQIRKATGEI